jgi:tetratricopeptide (TPR) repeat protein
MNRCEPASLREMAELFLREATAQPNCPEALVAHRISGSTCFYFGDFAGAHDHFQKTIELYDQARHADFANRFGNDHRVAAEAYDTIALWALGRIDEARRLAERAITDSGSAAHAPTTAYALMFAALLGLVRCNPEAVASCSQALADIVSRYDLPPWWAGWVTFLQGWAKWSDGAGESALAEMRRGLAIPREQGNVWFLPSLEAALAEAEASAGETDAGLRRLDLALAELERTEQRWYEAEMHRIRAEILLQRDPADTAAAEQSLQAAIAIAQSQKARSFELRAALALAKLYRAANRDADAHAVLAPTVEGFPPTRQFPELTEAQTLLAALSESDAVRSATALRQRRLQLQISLGNALLWAKGLPSPETSAAFARAGELASQVEDVSERFAAYYGLWAGHLTRCEPAPMREMAELFLREATARPDCPEVLVAHRISGVTCFHFGHFAAAHDHFRKTVELYDQTGHSDFANRFGSDPRAAAEAYDAIALWVLGRVDGALRLAERALTDAKAAAHAPTMGHVLFLAATLGLLRYNPETAATYSRALAEIVSRYDLPAHWAGYAAFSQGWAKWSEGAEESRLAEMRCGLAINREQGHLVWLSAAEGALAIAEARVGETDAGFGAWTMRSPSWSAQSNTGTKRKCTASAARSCGSATRPIPRRPSSLCRPRSPSRSRKKRGASNCAPRCLWRTFIARPIATPMRTPCWRRRSRASRRPNNSPNSLRRKPSSRHYALRSIASDDPVMPSAALPVGRRADPIRMTRPRIDWKGRFWRSAVATAVLNEWENCPEADP